MPKAKKKDRPPRKKRKTLKFFFSLIIMLGAAGTALYFGWIKVPPGEYAVIHTLSSQGWDPSVIEGGKFVWRWQALFPTNVTLYTFQLTPQSVEIEQRGQLNSGDTYASYISDKANFEWSIKTQIAYRLHPEALPELAADNMLASGLEHFYTKYESRLNNLVRRLIDTTTEQPTLMDLEKQLAAHVASMDPRIELLNLNIVDWRYPDLELYETAKKIAMDILNERQILMTEFERDALLRKNVDDVVLNRLSRYAEIFSKHPELLDFFKIEGNLGASLLSEYLDTPIESGQ